MTDFTLPTIKQVLMERDGVSAQDADEQIAEFKEALNELLDEGASLDCFEDLLSDFFGLEPDYLLEFLPL